MLNNNPVSNFLILSGAIAVGIFIAGIMSAITAFFVNMVLLFLVH